MSHISRKLGQLPYFDAQLGHPEWQGKYVLDFGGNAGNILNTPLPVIDEEMYWCLDISPDGIAEGKRMHPKAHFVFYDRYNIQFNPAGSKSVEVPPLGRQFDYILAYSVFTHVDIGEMDYLTGRLMPLLRPSGIFAFTFIDPFFKSWPGEFPGNNLQWRLDRMDIGTRTVAGILEKAGEAPCFAMAGDGDIYPASGPIPEPERYVGKPYHVFHTADFMRKHFPAAQILPPANYEMQHCCVLSNAGFCLSRE